jgi:hypothetical protein
MRPEKLGVDATRESELERAGILASCVKRGYQQGGQEDAGLDRSLALASWDKVGTESRRMVWRLDKRVHIALSR